MAQPTRPALPTGRRVEPGERAGEPLGAVDVAPQDGEDRREECRGEQDGDADHEQPTHAHRAGVRKRRGHECSAVVTSGLTGVVGFAALVTTPLSPTERVSESGVVTSAANPTTTVSPDVTTAEPAVSTVRMAASTGERPRLSSSRNRVTMRSE